MLPDGAGVDEQDRGLVDVIGLNEASRLEMAAHLIGVGHVHLAPVGAHVKLHKPNIISSTYA
jgi:hypothetical protein